MGSLLAIGLAIFVCLVSACATPERPNGEDEAVPMSPQSCDDAESISGIPPARLVTDLGAEIPPRVAGEGRIEFAPTSEGLPGFLPTGIYFPGPGCWRVTAVLGGDTATINVAVP